jgi:hypothetical protein
MCFYVLCIQIILLYVQIYLLTIRPTGGILFNWSRLPIPAHQFLLFNKEILNCNFLEEVSVH